MILLGEQDVELLVVDVGYFGVVRAAERGRGRVTAVAPPGATRATA